MDIIIIFIKYLRYNDSYTLLGLQNHLILCKHIIGMSKLDSDMPNIVRNKHIVNDRKTKKINKKQSHTNILVECKSFQQ